MLYEASAPGSTMLFGEHAVLHGHTGIASAINKRVTVTVSSSTDSNCHIRSDKFSEYSFSLDAEYVSAEHRFSYILSAINVCESKLGLTSPVSIDVVSNMDANCGFGSSAAIVVATISAVAKFLETELSKDDLFNLSLNAVHNLHGVGSGADIAASVYGGIVALTNHEVETISARELPAIKLVYCGYKTPTPEVISIVNSKLEAQNSEVSDVISAIGDNADDALRVLKLDIAHEQRLRGLGVLMSEGFKLQQNLGVSDSNLNKICSTLLATPNVYGAKISGAGLGDCVIALCSPDVVCGFENSDYLDIPVELSKVGAEVYVKEAVR